MRKIVIKYGLISAGISAIIWTILAFLMKNSTHGASSMVVGYASMLVSLFVIYFAMKNYRDEHGGEIKFWKALLVGFYISIIFAVFYVIIWMILRQTVLTDFWDQYIAVEIDKLQQANLSAEALAKKMAEIEEMRIQFQNPLVEASFVFIEPWPVSIIVTLVSALIVSRKKNKPQLATA